MTVMTEQFVKVSAPGDNVATFIRDAEANETVEITTGEDIVEIEVNEDIPFGHKIALENIDKGGSIQKYGKVIGTATTSIKAGDWVHVHNVESNYGRGDQTEEATS